MDYQIIEPQKIKDMLFDDAEYVIEFCEAGLSSFSEFEEGYSTHLPDRNMAELRKAGHKIKPGAQMMGADEVIEEYEHSKELLEEDATDQELVDSVEKMVGYCQLIKKELNQLAEEESE
ncbi:taurine dioxygenase [Fodinibius halophilus]|uniref:Taurine dioxygenase n=1 Tax=Fodinibius halophilus TaxID=1736908 RepID=A0A6M1TA62_9BACT|nr:taurine dioxygenase [Fodinibius halophilus]NGP88931.1 taurine dioxygenase [Fodinibius halophilus]